MKRIMAVWIAMLLPCILHAKTKRFVERYPLPDGRCAVVAEGDMEPRSIGSYSVRFYRKGDPRFPTDDFQAGIILERDGSVEKVEMGDINGDAVPELVIFIRNAGSGHYLSATAISINGGKPNVIAAVNDLDKNADAIAALRTRWKAKTE